MSLLQAEDELGVEDVPGDAAVHLHHRALWSLLFQSGRSEASDVSGHSNPATSLKKNTSNFDRGGPLLLEIKGKFYLPATDPTPDHPPKPFFRCWIPCSSLPKAGLPSFQGTVECIRHFLFCAAIATVISKMSDLPKLKLGPQ